MPSTRASSQRALSDAIGVFRLACAKSGTTVAGALAKLARARKQRQEQRSRQDATSAQKKEGR